VKAISRLLNSIPFTLTLFCFAIALETCWLSFDNPYLSVLGLIILITITTPGHLAD
jgi:hypothetical protein